MSLRITPIISATTLSLLPIISNGQSVVWTDGAGDQQWSSAANWSPGVPGATSDVFISTQPTGDQIAVDVGAAVIASLTYNNTLTADLDISAAALDTLQVNGSVTNTSSHTATFSLPFIAGASATWTGALSFGSNVQIGLSQITLANAIEFAGPAVTFQINSTTNYGRFLGSGTATFSGPTINFIGSYTGTLGDVFTIYSGGFSGATLGSLPSLSGGLSWDTSSFISSGQLSVIPEAQTWALLTAGLTSLMIFRRRAVA